MKIYKEIAGLFGATFLSKSLAILKGFVVAKYLTPEMFGLIDIVFRIRDLSKYGEFGFTSVIVNEYNFEKDPIKKEELRNVGYSADILVALLISTIIILSSFFFLENFTIFIGLLANGIQLFFIKLINLYKAEFRIKILFNQLAKLLALSAIIYNTVIILTVPFMEVYSPLILPLFAEIIIFLILFKKTRLDFRFDLNKSDIYAQFKKGIVLSGLTMMTGLSIYVERAIIINKFYLKGLGIFAIIFFLIQTINYFMMDLVRPLVPRIKEQLSHGNINVIKKYVVKPTLLLMMMSILAILVLYYTVPLLIKNYFPLYNDSSDILIIMLPVIYILASSNFSGYLLYSPGINKTLYAYLSHILYVISVIILSNIFITFSYSYSSVALAIVISSLIRSSIQNYVVYKIIYPLRISLAIIIVFATFPVLYLYVILQF